MVNQAAWETTRSHADDVNPGTTGQWVKLDACSLERHNDRSGKGEKVIVLYAVIGGPDWKDLTSFSFVQVSLLATAIAALMMVVVALARRLRGDAGDDRPTSDQMLTKFRELHARGGLSDEEFRTIKTTLARQFQNELRDDEETGFDDRSSGEKPPD